MKGNIKMDSIYKNMADILTEKSVGNHKLTKFTVGRNDLYAMVRCGISPGTYIKLTHNGEVVMSDTSMEKRTNMDFCFNAHGDVLIGGLGIGMIILAIQDRPDVRSITVLEKYQDVIDLVANDLPLNDKVRIINADVFDWRPEKGTKYNCIYMDIWNYINAEVYKKEMVPLTRKYSHYLISKDEDPKRFVDCWAKWEAKNEMRLY